MDKNKLTKQDMKFVEGIVEHGNRTQAAQEAYGIENYGYARVKGSEQLTKPNIQEAVKSLADRISNDKLVRVLTEGLDAMRGEDPDHATRHKFLDTSLKLKGAYTDGGAPNVVNQILVQFIDKKDDDIRNS